MFAGISEASAFAFNMPEIPGLGVTAGLEMYIQNRSVGSYAQFIEVGAEFLKAAERDRNGPRALPACAPTCRPITSTWTGRRPSPWALTLSDVFQTLQAMLSTYYVNDFNLFGKTYRVQAEAKPQFRTGPQDIGKLYVRSSSGAMVPVSAFSQGRMQGGPALVTRFNGFTAAQVNGEPAAGKELGRDAGGRGTAGRSSSPHAGSAPPTAASRSRRSSPAAPRR